MIFIMSHYIILCIMYLLFIYIVYSILFLYHNYKLLLIYIGSHPGHRPTATPPPTATNLKISKMKSYYLKIKNNN